MSENIGGKFIFNGQLLADVEFDKTYKDIAPSVYEVVRVMNGTPLFFEEHYERLLHSVRLLGHDLPLPMDRLQADVVKLAAINGMKNNNVKIVVNNISTEGFHQYCFLIKSSYPAQEQYKNGVDAMTYHAVRKNPNAKIIYQEMRDNINRSLRDTGKYEAILVDDKGNVTEGSRSNLFFLKEHVKAAADRMESCSTGCVYTAPAGDVLIGITRKKIIKLCRENGIEVMEAPIPVASLQDFDSCFISGTSPKVLPVRSLDDHHYDAGSPLLKRIMELYDEEIHAYVHSHS